MELGEKLRQARQEAGLSQRKLCGEYMTRNMLSLIENGTAKPSMDTLRYLAGQLGKPVGFFLEEDAVLSPNQTLMAEARQKWAQGQVQEVWLLLKNFRQPDPVLEWQWRYLSALADMEAAKLAARTGRERYALQLLEEAARWEIPELERQRLIQLGRLAGEERQRIRWRPGGTCCGDNACMHRNSMPLRQCICSRQRKHILLFFPCWKPASGKREIISGLMSMPVSNDK